MIIKFNEMNEYNEKYYILLSRPDWVGYFATNDEEIIDIAKAYCIDSGINADGFELKKSNSDFHTKVIYNNLDDNIKESFNFQTIYKISKWKKEYNSKKFNL